MPHFLCPGRSVGNWIKFLIRTVKLDALILGPENLHDMQEAISNSQIQTFRAVAVRFEVVRMNSGYSQMQALHTEHTLPGACNLSFTLSTCEGIAVPRLERALLLNNFVTHNVVHTSGYAIWLLGFICKPELMRPSTNQIPAVSIYIFYYILWCALIITYFGVHWQTSPSLL